LEQHGGQDGVRDPWALESAVIHPRNVFYYAQGDLFDVAAAYAFHLAESQAFLDGNKRTGIAVALVFLRLNGVTVLKLLQSEGELTIASTGKDPTTGRMETQEYHVEGPVMIILTTTAIDLDEELQNRCLTLAVDESPEQTARIHTLQRERRTLAGLVAKTERAELLRVLKNA
jgi:death-on-curing family protein